MNRNFRLLAFPIIISVLACCTCIAQEEDPNVAKLEGTWVVDVEKTTDSMDEEMAAQMKDQMMAQEMKMVFRADSSMDLLLGEEKLPGDPTFELNAQEDSENMFDIVITPSGNGPPPMKGTIEFMDDGSIKVTPENQPGMVLVREVEVVTMENAMEFFEGRWDCNQEATQKMIDDDEALENPGGQPVPAFFIEFSDGENAKLGGFGPEPMAAKFKIEATENENEFTVELTPEGAPEGKKGTIKVMGKNLVMLTPDTGEPGLILDRSK